MAFTTILDGRSKLEKIEAVAPQLADWERDPETSNGFVAELVPADRSLGMEIIGKLEAAGFEASWSMDDDGRYFIWAA